MNAFQIAGGVVSILGTILMFYGSYIQGHSDQKFQGTVEEFVKDQKATDVPELVCLSVEGKESDFRVKVKNVGKKSATKVKIVFRDDSTPSAFSANLIAGANEIPAGVEYEFPLNIFSGINMLMKVPNSKPDFKKSLKDSLDKFKSGQMAFIPRFHIEYFFGEQKLTSEAYYLVLDQKQGLTYFGKANY